MFWKFFRSDEKVAKALRQSGKVYDLSPDVASTRVPANNDAAAAPGNGKSRLYLEDWSEKDEERLKHGEFFWEGYGS